MRGDTGQGGVFYSSAFSRTESMRPYAEEKG